MRPETGRVWRKTARRALRDIATGRRSTHALETQPPRRGSSWHRRHPGSFDTCTCHAHLRTTTERPAT